MGKLKCAPQSGEEYYGKIKVVIAKDYDVTKHNADTTARNPHPRSESAWGGALAVPLWVKNQYKK